jgi:hypothetical protein
MRHDTSILRLTIMGLFSACGTALGFAFAPIPNLEFVTASNFIAGACLGVWEGFAVGVISESLYSLFNPFGFAGIPLLLAQVIGMGFAGALGGLVRRKTLSIRGIGLVTLGASGFAATVFFDFITTVSFLPVIGLSAGAFLKSLWFGLPFYAMHIISNTVVFLTVVPAVLSIFQRFPFALSRQNTGTKP